MTSSFIPPKTIAKMKELGVGYWELMDVFNKGEHKKSNSGSDIMIKKYSRYEMGLF